MVAFELAAAPGRAALEQLGPRQAEEQDRRVAREVGDVLDQVEEGRLAPSGCRRRRRRAAAPRRLPRAACGPPRRSRPASRPRPLAEQRRDRLGRAGRLGAGSALGRRRRAAFTTSTTRPVGDPLAVGEAAARDDARVDASEELRHEPRLADTRRPEQRERARSARRRTAFVERVVRAASARARDRPSARRGAARARARRGRRRPAGRRGHGSRLPLQLERLERLDRDRVARERAASRRRAGSRPARRPAASRAATLTASPVASRSSAAGHDLARVDARSGARAVVPKSRSSSRSAPASSVAQLGRRPHRAHRVVLVHAPARRRRPSPRRR